MFESYYRVNHVVGVSIFLSATGDAIFKACEIIIQGNQLTIGKKITEVSDLSELKSNFPRAH
jgi:hypothetical protein